MFNQSCARAFLVRLILASRNTISFPRARSWFHLSLFFKIRVPCARARVIPNLFVFAPHCITFGWRSRIHVEVCGVLQLFLTLSSSLTLLSRGMDPIIEQVAANTGIDTNGSFIG